MNELLRELAPITAEAWQAIDEEASDALKIALGARRVVDFRGPLGWEVDSVSTGNVETLSDASMGTVQIKHRNPLALVEMRVPFSLQREELEAIARGAKDADLQPVIEAARGLALAENRAVFHGIESAGFDGICTDAAATIAIDDDYTLYPNAVAEALSALRLGAVQGPFALALGPRCYTGLTRTTAGGYPVINHVQQLIDGPVVWANGLDGAVVISQRGGDFEMIVGRDIAIGFDSWEKTELHFYIEESFAFRVLDSDAVVVLRYEQDA